MTQRASEQADAALTYDIGAPRALVVAQGQDSRARAQSVLEAAGCVVLAPVGFETAARDPRLAEGVDLIFLDTVQLADAVIDPVLEHVAAEPDHVRVIAAIDSEQIDLVSARLLGSKAELLCAPSKAECVAAVAAAKWAVRGEVHDVAREAESLRLQRLNEEVARIADTLVRLTRGEERDERGGGVRAPDMGYRGPDAPRIEVAPGELRSVIRARQMRAQFFASELFADPAWDMLLDLFAASLEHRRVSVSSLCIAAAVPPTTALRWIGTMHDQGLFERHADPHDRRRSYIALSEKGAQGMRAYAQAVKRAGLPLV